MIYDLKFSPQADKIAKKWKKSNPSVYKKYAKILDRAGGTSQRGDWPS